MREDIKNLNELSDSRELLEARPNPMIAWFIYLLLIIFVSAILWTCFGEVDEVVKADGVVRTNETVSTVRNETPRQVKRIAFSEGQHVKKGDILFELDSSEEELQKEKLEEEIVKKEKKLKDVELLKLSIEKGENQIKDKAEDNEYYQRFQAYQSNLALIKQEHESAKLEVSENRESQKSQKESIQSQKERLESKSGQLKRLRDAINNKKNVFKKEETPYYDLFLEIDGMIEQLDKTVNETKEAYETLKENSNTTDSPEIEKQLSEAKKAYEESIVKRDQYKNQQLLQVNSEIEQVEDKIKEVEATSGSDIDFAKLEETHDKNYQASVEKYKSDSLVEVTNEIDDVEQQIEQLQHELSTIEQQIDANLVKAPRSGVVNVRTDISEGDLLQVGTEVLRIIPETNPSTYTVQLSVLNQDIAKTKIGDEVKFSIHSLPYEEYGKVKGKITQVSSDATIDPETGMSYYLVEATIDNETLYSHKGDEEAIKVGMTTEAHIVTDSKKILYFLLEKMHLKD